MPLRAGWVPCVGFQPNKPMVMAINTAADIAAECERVFQGAGSGAGEFHEEDSQRPVEKPPLKLLMNPKGVQDFQAVQEHYENLMNAAPTSPEVGKVVQSPVLAASPSGKGAELFAKRKKRMDKFIVDETTVQKAQQQTTSVQQSSSITSSFSSSSKSVSSSSSSFSSMKQAEMVRNQQQDQILISAPLMGAAPTAPAPSAAPAAGTGAIYTAEVKVVQRASLPPTPVDVPQHSLLDLVSQEDSINKRRSVNFNLAAKGFGTYNDFYKPVTFAT